MIQVGNIMGHAMAFAKRAKLMVSCLCLLSPSAMAAEGEIGWPYYRIAMVGEALREALELPPKASWASKLNQQLGYKTANRLRGWKK